MQHDIPNSDFYFYCIGDNIQHKSHVSQLIKHVTAQALRTEEKLLHIDIQFATHKHWKHISFVLSFSMLQ